MEIKNIDLPPIPVEKDYVIAYIDMLGTQELLSNKDTENVFEHIYYSILTSTKMLPKIEKLNMDLMQFKVFSDNILVAYPVEDGYFHYLTRGAYDVAYMTSTATSAGVKITISKGYKSVIPKLGLVDTSKDANPEFTCCFCEKTFSGKRNKHSAGATRPKTNDEGTPNYCCSSCFKKYVVPMIGYAYKLRLVRGLPGYEDVPRDEKEIFASIQKMSLREIKDTIKREDIAELVLPTLEMLAHAEENRNK